MIFLHHYFPNWTINTPKKIETTENKEENKEKKKAQMDWNTF